MKRLPKVSARERLTTPMDLAAPVQQHTRLQKHFRDANDGRFAADPMLGTHATCHSLVIYPDGTVDNIRLDQDGYDWIDLGGSGARDFAAGRM